MPRRDCRRTRILFSSYLGLRFATSLFRNVIRDLSWWRLRLVLILIMTGKFDRLFQALSSRAFVQKSLVFDQRQATSAQRQWPSDRPLVSVIVPCFNYGAYIDQAVQSILAQTFQDFEIIVVEGGSTDKATVEKLKSLAYPKTRVLFRNEPHQTGDNRNFGIAASRGKYVCCLDADDMLRPTYLEKVVYILETTTYDVVTTPAQNFGASHECYRPAQRNPVLADFVVCNPVIVSAVFRKLWWRRIHGYYDYGRGAVHVAEDWDFWVRMAAAGATFHNILDDPLFLYRNHGNSQSKGKSVRPWANQIDDIRERNAALLTPAAYKSSQARRSVIRRRSSGTINLIGRNGSKKKPSLLIVYPFLLVGGAERIMSTVVTHLTKQGWQVTIVTTDPYDSTNDSSAWFTKSTREVYDLPKFLPPEEWQAFIGYIIESRKIDAILLAGSSYFYSILPNIRATYPSVALMDLLFNTEGHTFAHAKHRQCFSLALCESSKVAQWYLKTGWNKELIRMIPSGVDVHEYSPAPRSPDLARRFDIKPDEIVIGFSGRLSEEKAPDVFMDVARACKDKRNFRFIMTGVGPMSAEMESKARGLAADVRFDYVGLAEDLRGFYNLYDIFVLPSRLDGRPTAIMEAMASGCAVVASNLGGIPDLVQDGITGLLCSPADVNDFGAKIRALGENPTLIARMKEAGRARALAFFDQTAMVRCYEQAFLDGIKLHRDSLLIAEAPEIEAQEMTPTAQVR